MPSKISGWPTRRVLGRNPQVARHRQLEAAAEGVAADRGEDGSRDRFDRVERVAKAGTDAASGGGVGELIDVGTSRERLLAPGHYDRFHGSIGGDVARDIAERTEHGLREWVHRRSVELHHDDVVLLPFRRHVRVGHARHTTERPGTTPRRREA